MMFQNRLLLSNSLDNVVVRNSKLLLDQFDNRVIYGPLEHDIIPKIEDGLTQYLMSKLTKQS